MCGGATRVEEAREALRLSLGFTPHFTSFILACFNQHSLLINDCLIDQCRKCRALQKYLEAKLQYRLIDPSLSVLSEGFIRGKRGKIMRSLPMGAIKENRMPEHETQLCAGSFMRKSRLSQSAFETRFIQKSDVYNKGLAYFFT